MAITIADIAKAAGVHAASVSRALSGTSSKVSAETRERITRIARELGYQPNSLAAALRTKQTHMVAIVVPDIGNPLFAPIVEALEAELSKRGMMCLIAQTPHAAEGRRQLVVALAGRRVSGLLVLAAEGDDPMLAEAFRLGLPTVLVNRGFGERRFSSVVNNDEESVRLVIEHLLELGHLSIAHIAGPTESSTGRARRSAYEDLCKQHGIEQSVIEATAFTREAGLIAARALFATGAIPSAIFAANDLIAMGVLDVLHERGLEVPSQISLVGHNDMPFVDLIAPPLTTVRIAVQELGRQGAQLLLELMATPSQVPTMRVLAPQLIVRKSTAPFKHP